MGLKGFNEFIQKQTGNPDGVSKALSLESLRGTRIAFDGHGWFYSRLFAVQKKNVQTTDITMFSLDKRKILHDWIRMAIGFCMKFAIEFGITPIFVVDGPNPPKEKSQTKQKRRRETQQKLDRIAQIEALLKEYDPLSFPAELKDELTKLYTSTLLVSNEDVEYFMYIFNSVGIPCIRAKGEAEELCSMLCIEGIASAVFSKDTDVFAYGCPLAITSLGERKWNKELGLFDRLCPSATLKDVLAAVNLPYKTFIDFCIILGTDFNDRVYRSQNAPLLKQLQDKGSIEDIDLKGKEILNHVRTREILSIKPWRDCMSSDYYDNMFDFPRTMPESLRETLDALDLNYEIAMFVEFYQKPIESKDRGFSLNPLAKKIVLNIKKT